MSPSLASWGLLVNPHAPPAWAQLGPNDIAQVLTLLLVLVGPLGRRDDSYSLRDHVNQKI